MKATPEAILATLCHHLRRSAETYDNASSADRRYLAAAALVDLTTILRMSPALADCSAFAAFKDIASFLADLEHGKSHPWGTPKSFNGSAKFALAKQELKNRVAVAVEVLIGSEMTVAEACRQVATILTRSKRKGRQDGPTDERPGFPAGTVKGWYYQCRSPDRDRRGHKFFNAEISRYRADARWPPTQPEALAFARRTLTNKLLRDQFTS